MAERSRKQSNRNSSFVREVKTTRLDDGNQFESFYHLGRKLGKGAFGVVLECTRVTDDERFAVKVVHKREAGSVGVEMMENELKILKRVYHDHIVRLEEVLETNEKVFMVMEFCGNGDLASLLKAKKRFTEKETHTVIQRLASAVAYMHNAAPAMVHRDLKLENILTKETEGDDLNIKLTDFGLSCEVGSATGSDSHMQHACGTPLFMAPEVLDKGDYTKQCDVWSIGVIMYWLLSGSPPFMASSPEDLRAEIKKGEVNLQTDVWASVKPSVKSLLRSMLEVKTALRISANEIVNHPWITGRTGEYTGTVMQLMSDALSRQGKVRIDEEPEEEHSGSAAAGGGSAKETDGQQAVQSKSTVHLSPDGVSRLTSRDQRSKSATSQSVLPRYMQPTKSSSQTTQATKDRTEKRRKVSTNS